MNLYKIELPADWEWDYNEWDAAVVAAPDENAARNIHPGGNGEKVGWVDPHGRRGWVQSPEEVVVTLVGVAAPGIAEGVIVGSFYAG